jgi:tetratricopeptide (TPR) repeat protein
VGLFQQSFNIDDTNPLTMKHLADHFFISDDLEISESLCIRALKFCGKMRKPNSVETGHKRRDIELLSSDLHFILGKIYHKREKYDEALTSYDQAVKLNGHNLAAQFCLAKIHFLTANYGAVDKCLSLVLSSPKYKDCFEAIRLLAKVKSL